jgi:hypothetical protein
MKSMPRRGLLVPELFGPMPAFRLDGLHPSNERKKRKLLQLRLRIFVIGNGNEVWMNDDERRGQVDTILERRMTKMESPCSGGL